MALLRIYVLQMCNMTPIESYEAILYLHVLLILYSDIQGLFLTNSYKKKNLYQAVFTSCVVKPGMLLVYTLSISIGLHSPTEMKRVFVSSPSEVRQNKVLASMLLHFPQSSIHDACFAWCVIQGTKHHVPWIKHHGKRMSGICPVDVLGSAAILYGDSLSSITCM